MPAAIEEAVVNAVYHRSYEEREPIEIRITPDELTVLSFPGPDRSVQMDLLRQGKAVARRYRNRRIGEFLKELELSEARCTEIPKILRAMKENGSEPPSFETDEERTSFLVRLPIRRAPSRAASPGPRRDQVGTKSGLSRDQVEVLFKCLDPSSLVDLLKEHGRTNRTKFRNQVIHPLLELGYLAMTIPEKPRSRYQKYQTTEAGVDAIHAIRKPLS